MLFFLWVHSLVFTHNVYDRQTRIFITMRMSCTIYFKHIKIQSTGAPNEDIVQNHLT